MINVLHLRDTDKVCGPGKTVLETCARADPDRFRLYIGLPVPAGSRDNLYLEACRQRGLAVLPIPTAHAFDPRIVTATLRLIREHDIHIVHSHDYKTDLLAALLARLRRLPIITTAHGWIVNDLRSRIYHGLGKRVMPYFDRVIAVSPQIRQQLLRIGVRPERAPLIHNCIVAESYRPDSVEPGYLRQRFGIPEGALMVGNIGRLSPEKGQSVFLDAAARLRQRFPQAWYVLVGDGRDRARLEAQARQLGIADRVCFTGHLQDVRPVFRDIDVLALNSYTEGFPNVVLEALCMLRPVAASAVGGVADVIEDGVTGLLLQAGDGEMAADRLGRLLGDAELRRRLAEAGRARVLERFHFHTRVDKLQRLYEEVLAERAAPLRLRSERRPS